MTKWAASASLSPSLVKQSWFFLPFYTVNVWNTSCSRHLDEPSRCSLRGKMRSTRTDPSQVLLVVKSSLTPNTCDGTVLKLPFYGAEKISKCLTQSNYRLGTPYYWCTISPVNYTQTPLLFLSSGPSARAAEGFPSTWFNIQITDSHCLKRSDGCRCVTRSSASVCCSSSCWTGRAISPSAGVDDFPQLSADDVYRRVKSALTRWRSCREKHGLCSLNVFKKKLAGAFFPSLTDWWMCKGSFFPPACLQTDGDATLPQHKPFISPIQKYKSGSFPHSFGCKSVTIKHPQVEVLCGGGVKDLSAKNRQENKQGDIL